MRIGINLFEFFSPGSRGEGVINYVRGLVQGLAEVDASNKYVLFVNSLNGGEFALLPNRFRGITVRLDPRKRRNRVLWEQVLLPLEFRNNRLDLIHFPSGTASLPLLRKGVVTYHAANVSFYASKFRAHTIGFKQFYTAAMERLITPRAAKIITDSEFSKQDLVQKLRVPAGKISVVHLTVPDEHKDANGSSGIESPYILDVSSSALHKNLKTLISAYALLKKRLSVTPKLVIAGAIPDQPAWGMNQLQELEQHAIELEVDRDVAFIPYPARDRLIALYKNAQLFVFPSLFEGFGLAPLEAMKFGVPVVLSDRASLPEVGGDAAVYVNPDDPADIARGMELVLRDSELRHRLIQSGLQRAESFGGWQRVAAETLAVYEQVFESRNSGANWAVVRKGEA